MRCRVNEARTEKDLKKNTTIVFVPASTYETVEEIRWFGQMFKVRYVYVEDAGKPYSVDFENRTLTIDTFYQQFQKYSLNFLEVIMTLDLSFVNILSDDPECDSAKIKKCLEQYKESVVRMLTAEYELDEDENLGIIKQGTTKELS